MVKSLVQTCPEWPPLPDTLGSVAFNERVWFLTASPAAVSNLFSNIILAEYGHAEAPLLESMIRLEAARAAYAAADYMLAMEKMFEALEFWIFVMPPADKHRKRLQKSVLASIAPLTAAGQSHGDAAPARVSENDEAATQAVFLLKRALTFLKAKYVTKNKADLLALVHNALATVSFHTGSLALARVYLEKAMDGSSRWLSVASGPPFKNVLARGTAIATALRHALLMYADDAYLRALTRTRLALELACRAHAGWAWSSLSWYDVPASELIGVACHNAAVYVIVSSSRVELALAAAAAAEAANSTSVSDAAASALAADLVDAMAAHDLSPDAAATALEMARIPRPLEELTVELADLEAALAAEDKKLRVGLSASHSGRPSSASTRLIPALASSAAHPRAHLEAPPGTRSRRKASEKPMTSISTYIALQHAPPDEALARKTAARKAAARKSRAAKAERRRKARLQRAQLSLPDSVSRADTLAMLEESLEVYAPHREGVHVVWDAEDSDASWLMPSSFDANADTAASPPSRLGIDALATTAEPSIQHAAPPHLVPSTSLCSALTTAPSSATYCPPDIWIRTVDPFAE
ncbi:uncharacterized protein AMSG_05049 [Thecamonas trahens ATCC 50062]|uniref:Uncharacterized protein n=1 Tax=Thecamonas trahens ATCC 50062 TaxID=461836 RepID=A0A0L0DA35_THETB|nr:hypothetical protein AMSG_05049 [Thecamonas trahens ATCC 50062]KNC49085.1 hypothetical protein AMSG_05049 [Thecamonas trahens ATCC 50062]|eukprot:XP_013758116.1 hypothetical protein AMSG_05049 [Thecamonas trahens ATCC 50062]